MAKLKQKIVFIDTEQFDTHKLSFDNANFHRLAGLVENGLAKVLLTEVVDGEVRRHIRKAFEEAKKTLGTKFGGLFHNLSKGPTPPPLTDSYWAQAEKEVTDQFKACLIRLKAEVLPLEPQFVKAVFDWYFAFDAPFDSSKRKAEFPDAFSIACINEWADKQRELVHVISKDEAFRITSREVKRSSQLIRIESLPAFFELFPDPAVASAIKSSFVAIVEDEDNYSFGEEEFRKLSFYVEESGLDVESVSIMYSEPRRLHVVEAKDGKAVIAGEMYINFYAEIDGVSDPVERGTFVTAEIAVEYDVNDPEQIEVKSIKYDKGWAIGVSLPSSYRHED